MPTEESEHVARHLHVSMYSVCKLIRYCKLFDERGFKPDSLFISDEAVLS